MNIVKTYLKTSTHRVIAFVLGLLAVSYVSVIAAGVLVDNVPLSVPNAVPGNLVLVPSVEWPTVVTQANDPGLGDGSSGYPGYSIAVSTTCPSGYTQSSDGSSCYQSVAPTSSCPNDGNTWTVPTGGTSCTRTAAATSTTTYAACPSGYTTTGTPNTVNTICSRTTNSTCLGVTTPVPNSNPRVCSGGAAPTTTYSCGTGGSLSGSTCTYTGAFVYSCPAGSTVSPSGTVTSSSTCVTNSQASTSKTNAYAGYFNSGLCYAYHYDAVEANRYFYPVANATAANTTNAYSCAGLTGASGSDATQHLWSGNFMNWASMQAIDTFRLALTGGYRVNLPAEGTPPNVTITDSSGRSTSYATSEQASTTYLEKANGDRWDNSYTKLRTMASGSSTVDDATPVFSTTTSGFHTRVAALRNQMWFAPSAAQAMGAGRSYSDPRALALPIVSGDQTEPGGATGTGLPAIPYNPTYHTLPDADTTTVTNGTACGATEEGCSTTTPLCASVGSTTTTWNGTACTGTTVGTTVNTTALLCPAPTYSSYPYFYNSGGGSPTLRCQKSSSNTGTTSPLYSTACAASTTTVGAVTTTVTVAFPITTSSGAQCTLSTTTATAVTGTSTPQYIHTIYGRNQVYAVSVRVKVCDGTWDTRTLCTAYGSYFKPEGLLQKNAKKTRYSVFSYLVETGQVRQGGVMRARQKLISPVSAAETAGTEKPYPDRTGRIANVDNPEWDSVTGVFLNNPDTLDATATSNNIGSCTTAPDGSGCVIQYSGVINYLNRFGQINTGQPTLKSYDNLSEMFYTAVRYLRGLANLSSFSALATISGTDISGTGSLAKYQNADGFPVIEDWFKTGNANTSVRLWNASPAISVGTNGDPMLYQCQTTVMLGIGDTHTNSEDDQYSCDNTSGGSGSGSTTSCATWRGYTDATGTTDKRVDVAGLAYWAHLNDMRADVPNSSVEGGTPGAKRGQTASTYWVDVVEQSQLYTAATSGSVNQYYNATKYGGYTIPLADWDTNGNAMAGSTTPPHNASWFTSNYSAWTSATANINATLTSAIGFSGGDYREPNNMFFGNNGQAMIDGLTSAFNRIGAELSGSGASLAANSTQLNNGTTTFQALYFTGTWLGDLRAFAVNANGTINTATLWAAANNIPAAASRVIKTTTNGTAAGVVNFDTSIGSGLRTALGSTTSDQNNVINFLRGDTSNSAYRSRTTVLGDIVDSQPVFVGPPDPNLFYGKTFTGSTSYVTFASNKTSRSKRVWVNANDGMLHAFNAECAINSTKDGCTATTPVAGAETFAYMPKAVLLATGTAAIKNLTDKNYGNSTTVPHQYFNDGELTVADVYFTSDSAWHTVLVGTTGRGLAKAIYALDITDPTTTPSLLWERSAGDGNTGSNYIGQMNGKPIIAQTSDGVWSVLIANGYNSSANSAALLQFRLSDGSLTVRTTDDTVVNNGLAVPAVWMDSAVNGVSTDAYAGDLFGNVWHFDLTTTGAGSIIFIAKDTQATPARQPITAGILIGKDPDTSNLWIFFGTGRYLTQTDLRDTSVQTWYGLIVEGSNAVTSATARSSLTTRSIAYETAASGATLAARAFSRPTANDLVGKSGWYLDLMYTTALGERMVTPNQFQGSLLLGTTRVPTSSDPCNPSGSGWIMAINPFTGAPPSASFFDVSNNGTVGTEDLITNPSGGTTTGGTTGTTGGTTGTTGGTTGTTGGTTGTTGGTTGTTGGTTGGTGGTTGTTGGTTGGTGGTTGGTDVAAGIGFSNAPNNPIFVGQTMLLSFDDASRSSRQTAGTVGVLRRLTWREMVAQ